MFVANGVTYVIKVAFLPNGYSGPHAWYVVAFSSILFGDDAPMAGPYPTKEEAVLAYLTDYRDADDARLCRQVLGARNELLYGT